MSLEQSLPVKTVPLKTPFTNFLGKRILARVFWRSLFLQATWNPRGMQNIGFAYALHPALRKLYPDRQDLIRAMRRHTCCFNTHPYLAAAIIGGSVHYEERIARGEEIPEAVNAFKQSLMGPLAALGDGFFWISLRPACGVLAMLPALILWIHGHVRAASLVAVGVYLLIYNAIHLAMRISFFVFGYRLGDDVVSKIASTQLPAWGQRLRVLAAIGIGIVGGLAVTALPTGLERNLATMVEAGGFLVVCSALQRKGVSSYVLVYGMAALTLFIGLIF